MTLELQLKGKGFTPFFQLYEFLSKHRWKLWWVVRLRVKKFSVVLFLLWYLRRFFDWRIVVLHSSGQKEECTVRCFWCNYFMFLQYLKMVFYPFIVHFEKVHELVGVLWFIFQVFDYFYASNRSMLFLLFASSSKGWKCGIKAWLINEDHKIQVSIWVSSTGITARCIPKLDAFRIRLTVRLCQNLELKPKSTWLATSPSTLFLRLAFPF